MALVEEREADPADVACASLPRLRDEVERRVAQLADRADVLGAVDDDLLALQRGIEVRDDADAPPGRAAPEAERLRWRHLLVAGAEGAVMRVARGRREGARPLRAGRRDRDPAARRGVGADVGQCGGPAVQRPSGALFDERLDEV